MRRNLIIGGGVAIGSGIILAAALVSPAPARGWVVTSTRAQVGALAALDRDVAGRVQCPSQLVDGGALTYADGCPTFISYPWGTVPAPSAYWTRHVSRAVQCAPGLYAYPLSGSEAAAYVTAQNRCAALGDAAPPRCGPISAMPALVGDAARNAQCAAARAEAGGVEQAFDDAGNADPPDDFANDEAGL